MFDLRSHNAALGVLISHPVLSAAEDHTTAAALQHVSARGDRQHFNGCIKNEQRTKALKFPQRETMLLAIRERNRLQSDMRINTDYAGTSADRNELPCNTLHTNISFL